MEQSLIGVPFIGRITKGIDGNWNIRIKDRRLEQIRNETVVLTLVSIGL